MLVAAAEVLSILLVGRVGLALLPPGWPGGRRGAELWATLGASFLLGLGLLGTQRRLHGLLGLGESPWALLGPWLVVAGLRLASLPAPMRPRLERSPQAPAGLARGLAVVAGGVLGWVGASALAGQGGGDSGAQASGALAFVACSALVAGALAEAGLAPLLRALALGACALAGVSLRQGGAFGSAALAASLALAGASVCAAWSRRADRRAPWLAVGLGATAALLGRPAWAWAGAALLPLVLARIGPGLLPDRSRASELGAASLGLAASGLALALAPGLPAQAWLALVPGSVLAAGLVLAPDPAAAR